MRGNSHVRFLGGGGAVMRRRYPTSSPLAGKAGAQAPVFLCHRYAKAWLSLVSMTKNMTINYAEK